MLQTLLQSPDWAAWPNSLKIGPIAAAATNGSRNMTSDSRNETATILILPRNNLSARLRYGPAFKRGTSLKRMLPLGSGGSPSFGSSGSSPAGIAPGGSFGACSPIGVPAGKSGKFAGSGFGSGI